MLRQVIIYSNLASDVLVSFTMLTYRQSTYNVQVSDTMWCSVLLMLPAQYVEQGLCKGWMSDCLSQQSTAACSGIAADFAEHPLGRRYQSTAVGALQAQAAATALQQAPVLSSKHEQQHPDIQRKRLNTELFAKRSRKRWRYQVEEKAVDNASDVRF